MTRIQYSKEFREQALGKVRQRGTRTVQDVALELNMSVGTLRKWVGRSNRHDAGTSTVVTELPAALAAQAWSPAQRLLALQESHGLSDEALHAWCREKGLFDHQLRAWREAFCGVTALESRESRAALRELQNHNDGLQRELRRKEKALAEAAALLVLQKKYQALWEDEEK